MAERRSNHTNTAKNSGSKNKKSSAVIWIIIAAVLIGAVVFATSNYYDGVKRQVRNNQYPRSYSEYVTASAEKYHLEESLVYAVIRTESNFNASAESPAGAYGLMQITGDTFDHYMNLRDEAGKYTTQDLFDPAVNIDYGCNILSDLLEDFGDENCAVAAYNAGPGNVTAWLENPEISTDGKTLIVENIPYEETRNYVERVESAKKMYEEIYY